jgi:hypothetical protein
LPEFSEQVLKYLANWKMPVSGGVYQAQITADSVARSNGGLVTAKRALDSGQVTSELVRADFFASSTQNTVYHRKGFSTSLARTFLQFRPMRWVA